MLLKTLYTPSYLLCLLWIPVCDVDYEDVRQVHPGSDHHEGERVAEARPAFTGPLSLLPNINNAIIFYCFIIIMYLFS